MSKNKTKIYGRAHTLSRSCHCQSSTTLQTSIKTPKPSFIFFTFFLSFSLHKYHSLPFTLIHLHPSIPPSIHLSLSLSPYLLLPYIMPSSSSSSLTLIHPLSPTPPPPPMDWFSWLSRTSLEPSLIYDYGVTFARNQLDLEDASFFNHEFLQSMGISIAKHRLEILKLAHNDDYGHDHHHRHHRPKKLSGVFKNYIRKCLRKLVVFREEDRSSSDQKDSPGAAASPPEPNNWYYHEKWRGAMERKHGSEEFQKPIHRARSIALSGPLDGRTMMMNEKMLNNSNKMLRLSGPLDGKRHDRLLYPNRSPLVSGRPMSGPVKSPRSSGPLDPRLVMMECKSPRLSRPSSDARPESPLSFSPYLNKAATKGDFDFDEDDHTLWPALFQDLKPT